MSMGQIGNGVIGIIFVLMIVAIVLIIIVFVRKYQKWDARDEKRIENIVNHYKSSFFLDKNVIGFIRVMRHSLRKGTKTDEVLVITPNKVFVEGIAVERIKRIGIDDYALRRTYSYDSFSMPKSEIVKVELNKFLPFWRKVKLNIITGETEYSWFVQGFIPKKKGTRLENYESLLRPIFGDKLSVKK